MLNAAGSARTTRRFSVVPSGQPDFAATLSDDAVWDDPGAQEIDLRQLRHHTKNTLQRIMALITERSGMCDTPAAERFARELEYRIGLSATISNALFGLTEAPGSMADRLRQLGGGIVEMMRGAEQVIRIGVSVRGTCPPALREAVIRGANELIGNAVKHGMRNRPGGRISVRLVSVADITVLSVTDDGWGFSGLPHSGEGLSLAQGFAERHGGTLRLESAGGTVATMELPHRAVRFGGTAIGSEVRKLNSTAERRSSPPQTLQSATDSKCRSASQREAAATVPAARPAPGKRSNAASLMA
nr:ATP-binding protein [uncultured Rhodopila sp.]